MRTFPRARPGLAGGLALICLLATDRAAFARLGVPWSDDPIVRERQVTGVVLVIGAVVLVAIANWFLNRRMDYDARMGRFRPPGDAEDFVRRLK
jgi:hypothetical protein